MRNTFIIQIVILGLAIIDNCDSYGYRRDHYRPYYEESGFGDSNLGYNQRYGTYQGRGGYGRPSQGSDGYYLDDYRYNGRDYDSYEGSPYKMWGPPRRRSWTNIKYYDNLSDDDDSIEGYEERPNRQRAKRIKKKIHDDSKPMSLEEYARNVFGSSIQAYKDAKTAFTGLSLDGEPLSDSE